MPIFVFKSAGWCLFDRGSKLSAFSQIESATTGPPGAE
jgi:hypothetical protein